jgi:hypothetical protein
VISERKSAISTRMSVISIRRVQFPHAECNFHTQECNCHTKECDFHTLECDFYMHSVISTRKSAISTRRMRFPYVTVQILHALLLFQHAANERKITKKKIWIAHALVRFWQGTLDSHSNASEFGTLCRSVPYSVLRVFSITLACKIQRHCGKQIQPCCVNSYCVYFPSEDNFWINWNTISQSIKKFKDYFIGYFEIFGF